MNAGEILKALNIRFSTHDYVLNNVFMFDCERWESDFFSITKDGYVYEVEVKISKSDFRADFTNKWQKHKILSAHKTGIAVYSKGEYPYYNTKEEGPQSRIQIVDYSKTHIPNRFFYACPKGLISETEVPSYAGLIYINELRSCTTIKNAPLLHTHKHDMSKKLLDKYYWKHFNLKNEYESLKRQNDKMSEKLKELNVDVYL